MGFLYDQVKRRKAVKETIQKEDLFHFALHVLPTPGLSSRILPIPFLIVVASWCHGHDSGGMKVVSCGLSGLWVLWHGFLLCCGLVQWLWRGGGVIVGLGGIWVVG